MFKAWWRRMLCKRFGHKNGPYKAWGNQHVGGHVDTCERCGYWEKVEEYNEFDHHDHCRTIDSGYTDIV